MSGKLKRRDFLKVLGLIPPAGIGLRAAADPASFWLATAPTIPNIAILVFDALSARHMSLYGYPRETTPHMTQFADRGGIVFHQHHSGGNFTSPGAATVLTGTYPWRHRAFNLQGEVLPSLRAHNLFSAFRGEIFRKVTYTHNLLAGMLLHQFSAHIDMLKKNSELCLHFERAMAEDLFQHDHNAALVAERNIFRERKTQLPSSLISSMLQWNQSSLEQHDLQWKYRADFPLGLPGIKGVSLFLLEEAIDWVVDEISSTDRPLVGYFHFFPPHSPYNTRHEFVDRFNDGWRPEEKPAHFFSEGNSRASLLQQRRSYDEYIAYADSEFGRLVEALRSNGALENTILVLTADHGEMFERGIVGHITPTLFEPIIHVPLIISLPGQDGRRDIHELTSHVDLLPTLLDLAREEIPSWCEGMSLLPSQAGVHDGRRAIYAVEAKNNPREKPLSVSTVAILRGRFKLIQYLGYPGFSEQCELYDLAQDREERVNLYSKQPELARALQDELRAKLSEVDEPFRSG
jgi:arylsulfatase A-like enzyme